MTESNRPFVSPSLNRVRVAKLPDGNFPNHLQNLDGFTLLSAASLQAMIRARSDQLGLSPTDPHILKSFDACFHSPSTAVLTAAQEIGEEYGCRLALLLATLKLADPINRLARPSWGDQQWEFWQSVKTIHIGGGLLAGAMGPIAVSSCLDMMQRCGCGEMTVHLSPYGPYLPLVGLAQTAPVDSQAMLALDFGQTNIKQALFLFRSGSINEMIPLPNIPIKMVTNAPKRIKREHAQAVAGHIVELVAQSWEKAQHKEWPLCSTIGLSLACYLVNGHPPPSEMGYYGSLQLLTGNVQSYLNCRISEAVGHQVQINLYHDGTAAALAFTGSLHTAVLTLGTAIGIGIPPEVGSYPWKKSMEIVNWKPA